MRNSLRIRMMIILLGLAIGPLLLAGIILAQRSFTSEQRVAYDLQTQVAQNVATEVEALLQAMVNELSTLGGEIRSPQEVDRAQQLSILLGALSTGPYGDAFEELTLLNNLGKEQIRLSRQEITPESELGNRAGLDEFELTKSTRSTYFSAPQLDEASGNPYITVAIPLYKPRSVQLSAIIVARVRFETLGNLLRRVNVGEDQTVYITDENGNLLAHQDRAISLQDSKIELPAQANTQRGLGETDVVIAAHRIQLGEQAIYVVAEKSTSKALALARNTIITIAIIIAATILLAGGLGFQAVRQIVIPIEELAVTAELVTAGDLSQKASIKGQDEIGALGTAFNTMTTQLQDLIGSLEQRVVERTTELEAATQQVEHRAEQFEAIAEVARVISSIQNQEELLPRITHMISRSFGFYHVGIFLVDENNQFAVLRAANSEGGERMLARQHRLAVGHTGIVGHVTSTGSPRIALDTGADAIFFDNPDLPETRSEIALPLKAGDQIIGALDVQSTEPNAFTQEDINILSALADQVSTAIQNALLYEESREALSQAETAYRQLTGQTWSSIEHFSPVVGYRFDGSKPEPLTQHTNGKQVENQKDAFSVPVQLRGESIGRLRIKQTAKDHQWTEDEVAIIRATAERVALALESARLLESSQRQAAKEQKISDITAKIGASVNMRNVLQTAVEELGRAVPGSEVVIRFDNDGK